MNPDHLWFNEARYGMFIHWGVYSAAGRGEWFRNRECVRQDTAKDGGNLLLNVGPKSDGSLPAATVRILREAGEWVRRHREAISGSERTPFGWSNWGCVTVKGGRVYLHIRNGTGSELCWAELKNRVLSARWLHDGAPVEFEQKGERLFLRGLPTPLPDALASVLVLEVEGKSEPLTAQTIFWIPGAH